MELAAMRSLVDEAIEDGLIFRAEGTVLSSAEGFNVAGRAVLGALLDFLGLDSFNIYCRTQKQAVGWFLARSTPISQEARVFIKTAPNDPTVRSMLTDIRGEFIEPLLVEHERKGGRKPSDAEVEATVAMLLAKILWDFRLGNADLSRYIGMLRASPR